MPGLDSPGWGHRVTPSRGHWVDEFLQELPQVAHGSQTSTLSVFHILSTMETLPSPLIGLAHFFALITPEMALPANLPPTSS